MIGAALVAVFALIVISRSEYVKRSRKACDGCRAEDMGSSMPFLTHTCSRSRAKYRDRKGRVHAFGRNVTDSLRRKVAR